jgi:hypothetical protein
MPSNTAGWTWTPFSPSCWRARHAARHHYRSRRAASLREAADTVSDIGMEKHAFQSGIKAMPGLGVLMPSCPALLIAAPPPARKNHRHRRTGPTA